MGGDAPACAQHVAGDCQLMGGCANISDIVVEHEVFEVNKFTVDPQRGAGIAKVHAFDPPRPDRRTGDALVETRQHDARFKSGANQGRYWQLSEIVTH